MSDNRKAILDFIESIRLVQLKDMLEPLIVVGMKKFNLEFWEFAAQPTSKDYNPDVVTDHLKQTKDLPPAEMLNWLLNHHKVKAVRACRSPDGRFGINWEL